MDLNEILVFARVVAEGSFTAAAGELGMAKSTVSRKVSSLEDRLDARLLHRTTRKLSLTDAGRTYHAYAARIAEEVEAAGEAMARLQEVPRGLLRVTAPLDLPFVGPVCAGYLDRHPEVQLDLVCTDRVVDIVKEGFDVALRVGPLSPSSLISRRLASWEGWIVAGPGYLARRGTPEEPADLEAHDAVVFGPREGRGTWELVSDRRSETVEVSPRMVCNEFAAIVEAVAADLGIAVIPSFRCAASPRCRELRRVLPDWSSPEATLHAVYPSRRHLSPNVKTFLDHARDALRPPPWETDETPATG